MRLLAGHVLTIFAVLSLLLCSTLCMLSEDVRHPALVGCLLLPIAWPAAQAWRSYRQRRILQRIAAGQCVSCGYDLRATPEDQSRYPSTTPPESEQIEVTDPTHPLFGRRFPLAERRGGPQERSACLLVAYRDSILIRLPLIAIRLASAAAPAARTKLDAGAVRQLLAFVKECEPPCHPSSPKPSGRACRRRAAGRSPKTSSPSSRS